MVFNKRGSKTEESEENKRLSEILSFPHSFDLASSDPEAAETCLLMVRGTGGRRHFEKRTNWKTGHCALLSATDNPRPTRQ